MPELPEVETVARDLRPRIVGATIVGARCSWPRTLRTHDPEAFARAVAGRRIEAVDRRAKLVVVDLSGAAALTIHLKMTGQLFVVPAGDPGRPVRPARPRARRRSRAPLPGHPQVRPGGALPARPADGRAGDRGRRLGRLRRSRPGAARRRLHPARVPGPAPRRAGVGSSRSCSTSRSWPASATSTPTRRSGRPGSTRSGARGPLRPADERRLYGAIRSILAEAVERRGSSIDDYTAPDGDGEMQEQLERLPADRRAVPALRSADPADRDRRAGDPLLLVVPAPAGRRPGDCAGGSWRAPAATGAARDGRSRAGPRWTELAGEGTLGLTAAEAANAAARARTERTRAGRGEPSRRRPEQRPGALVSILRFERVVREIGTFVILDEVSASRRARRPDRPRRAERRRQDDPPADRRRASTSRIAARSGGSAA